MPNTRKTSLLKDVTCPFCSLLCDDLQIKHNDGQLTVFKNGCARAVESFELKESYRKPAINGVETTLSNAIGSASSILRKASRPLFGGGATDISGSREFIKLAEKTGAIVDHMHGDGMINNIRVLQSKGWVMTTLTEIKNRADLVIFAGTDAVGRYPRFFERIIWNQASLSGIGKNDRKIVYIGDNLNTKAGKRPNGSNPLTIECSKSELNETLAVLSVLLVNGKIATNLVKPVRLERLKKLAKLIEHAKYGVIVWDAAEFGEIDGDLTVTTICNLVRTLNRLQRFAGLSLGGNDGSNSLMNVCSWQSGFPIRVGYQQGFPEFEPYSYKTGTILQEQNTDALLWLNSFGIKPQIPRTGVRTIVLARPYRRIPRDVDVYIPVGVPGMDHTGTLTRTDNVVSLPLVSLRNIGLPSAADVLREITKTI